MAQGQFICPEHDKIGVPTGPDPWGATAAPPWWGNNSYTEKGRREDSRRPFLRFGRRGLRRRRFLSEESGGKERVGAGDFDFPRPNTPPLKTTKEGELRSPLFGNSPGLFCRKRPDGGALLRNVPAVPPDLPAQKLAQEAGH